MSQSVTNVSSRANLYIRANLVAIFGAVAIVASSHAAVSQSAVPDTKTVATMEKFTGVWVEGPGFDITYGRTYDACSQRCLETATCVMIEYYRPEKKCNLYSTLRPRMNGGSSTVAVRR
jgi:hypothetical protein